MKEKYNYKPEFDSRNAKRINEPTYAYKVLISEGGYILGAHLIGPHAEETINLFALAIKSKIKSSVLKSLIYSYPSMASDVSSMV
jgi:glutathione reductase (NADPH)